MKDRMEIQQLKKMGKNELLRLVQDCDDENRKLAEDNEKKQSRIRELEEQVTDLQGQMAELREERKKAELTCQQPGSLAEAMIQVNGVMKAAQNAAKQYLDRIREMEDAKRKEAEVVVEMARRQAEQIVSKAKAGAEQVKAASTNVLQSLQTEIDRMLAGARGEYESRIVTETPVPGAEAYINNMDMPQSEPEKVPRLNEILNPEAPEPDETAKRLAEMRKKIAFAEPGEIQETRTEISARELIRDTQPDEAAEEKKDDFTDGLSDEIKNVIDDLTYRTQHIGETQ